MPPDHFERIPPSPSGDATDRATDRFWDHVAQGLAEDAGGVDPADAATIRHLHRFDDRPDPAVPFVRQLREDLMATHAIPIASAPRPALGPTGAPPNGRVHRYLPCAAQTVPPNRARTWARLPLQVAAAALIPLLLTLVLLTLGIVSYLAFWPDIDDRSTSIPAAVETETPPSRPLLSVVLDAELFKVPAGGLSVGHFVDEPGFSQAITFPSNGVAIVHVVSGAYTVRSEGPAFLLGPPADGTAVAESIPAGQDVTAHAGETLLYLSSMRTEESNRGDEPTERYTFVVSGPDQPMIENKRGTFGGEFVAYAAPGQWLTPASGPVTVTFTIEDATTPQAVTWPTGYQVIGELPGPSPHYLVITLSPGNLPGATPVELSTS